MASFAPAITAPSHTHAASAAVATSASSDSPPASVSGASRVVKTTATTMSGEKIEVYVNPDGGDEIVLPIKGPSKRSLVMGGLVLVVLGAGAGGASAWRAFRSRTPVAAAQALVPETTVTLMEMPQLVPQRENAAGAAGAGGAVGAAQRGTGAPRGAGSPNAARGTSANGAAGSADTEEPENTANSQTVPTSSGTPRVPSAATRPTATAGNTAAAPTPTTARPATGNTAANATPDPLPRNQAIGTEGSGLAGPRGPSVGGYSEGEQTDATGTADPRSFTFVYRHYRSQVTSCHSNLTRSGVEIAGRIRLRIRLSTEGHVRTTRVLENTTHSDPLAECVQERIRLWRYPAPVGGEVEFEYNLAFGG